MPVSSQGPDDAGEGALIESDSDLVERKGDWQVVQSPDASGGSYLYSRNASDSLLIEFEGSALEVRYVNAASASFAIEVDRSVLRTVTPDPSSGVAIETTTVNYLDAGRHILRVYGVDGGIAIDAFYILPSVIDTSEEPAAEPKAPPSNDAYTAATAFTSLPGSWSQTTIDATKAGNDPIPSCLSTFGATVWYKYTPSVTQAVEVSSATSDFDTIIAVYVGSNPGNFVEVACDDDNNASRQSTAVFNALVGNTYYIMVAGWSGATGTLNLTASLGSAPTVPTLVSPNSAITSSNNLPVQYTWTPLYNATWYEVYIQTPSGSTSTWYQKLELCSDYNNQCILSVNYTVNGAYVWGVRSWGPGFTASAWSTLNFSINIAAPSVAVTKSSPANGSTITASTSASFVWNHIPNTGVWYQFTLTGGSTNISEWHNNKNVCIGGTCSVDKALSNGTYTWSVRAWSPGGMGPVDSVPFTFTINVPAPGIVTLTSPSGVITDFTPTLAWQAQAQSMWYKVKVTKLPSTVVYDAWHEASTVCVLSCSLNPFAAPIEGSFQWTVTGWNSIGMGPESTPMSFSLDATVRPAGASSKYYPVFRWKAIEPSVTTWYQLYIATSTGTQLHMTWYDASKVCNTGGTCQVMPNVTLNSPTNYVWAIQPWGASYGTGAWSSTQAFTIGADTDQDGLTDAEEATLSTNPNNADSDGDALKDGWEVNGYLSEYLPLYGTNPRRKNILVEMDYMVNNAVPNGLAPNQNVIDGIIDVFENADVSNPDGSMGIDIYLELSNQVPLDLDLNPYAAEFYAIKGNAANFNVERTILFHYMIWANAYGGGTSSGVSMGIPAADFIVTLGPAWGVVPDGYKIGTFVHELGHNLNLTHGGAPGDHGNYKANHISVMNYHYQLSGVDQGSAGINFDYQRFALNQLVESSLNESIGLNNSATHGWKIRYSCGTVGWHDVTVGGIDWNCNSSIDGGTVSVNLDGGSLTTHGATIDQWAGIVYNGGGIGSAGLSSLRLNQQRQFAEEYMLSNPEPELDAETARLIMGQ